MKKILAIAILLSSLFALASCKDVQESVQTTTEQTTQATTESPNETKEYHSNGNLKTLTVFDDNGNVVSVAKYNDLGYCTEEYLFDSKGREKLITTYENFNQNGIALTQSIYDPIKATTVVKNYSKDGAYIERVTSYNENYLPVKDEYFDAESNVLKYELYDYHDNLNVKSIFYYKGNEKDAYVIYDENGVLLSSKESGKPAKIFFYNLNGELEEVKEHTYSAGEIVQINKYSESGNLLYRLDYEIKEYDALLQSRTDFNEDGNGFIKTVYEYNKNELLQSKTDFDDNGNTISIITYSYYYENVLPQKIEFYDAVNGTKTVEIYENNGQKLKETLVYNEKGQLLSLQNYRSNGELSDKILYYYDENGLNIRVENVSSSGTLLCYALTEYHPNGKIKTEASYNADGTIEYRADYYETGELLREYLAHQAGNVSRTIEYSKSGNIIHNQDYENGILIVDTVFKDSSSPIMEKSTLYNEDGSLREYTVYEANQTITYYPDGTVKQLVELDENGKVKISTKYNPDGSVNIYTIGNTSYYPNGNKYSETEIIGYYDTMTKYYTIDGEYDGCFVREDNGGFITETKYDAQGNVISVKEYSTAQPG
ncbi:MAG: hypothetical protein E7608_05120 [Ruminococcaceae bacterium]|nr:hypothetical protein [Oscillospiraceae bacterium]